MMTTLTSKQPSRLSRALCARFLGDQSGATAIEYSLIAAGVAVAVAATVYNLGSATKGMFNSVASKL